MKLGPSMKFHLRRFEHERLRSRVGNNEKLTVAVAAAAAATRCRKGRSLGLKGRRSSTTSDKANNNSGGSGGAVIVVKAIPWWHLTMHGGDKSAKSK